MQKLCKSNYDYYYLKPHTSNPKRMIMLEFSLFNFLINQTKISYIYKMLSYLNIICEIVVWFCLVERQTRRMMSTRRGKKKFFLVYVRYLIEISMQSELICCYCWWWFPDKFFTRLEVELSEEKRCKFASFYLLNNFVSVKQQQLVTYHY